MCTDVYLDNNVWDFLLKHHLNLAAELPKEEYCLCITREAEFEIPAIPAEKKELLAYIGETIAKCHVETRPYFGFYDDDHFPDEQRVGGFDEGYLATDEEAAFMEQQKAKLGQVKKTTTKLYKNEADISLAARSFHAIVLTLDRKNGPILDAYKQGGKVVFLNEFDRTMSLRDFIQQSLEGKP